MNDEPSAVAAGPKTEKAMGYVGLVTEVVVVAGIIYWTIRVAKLLGH